ncbi:serine hydrolase domain-containing protein [Actinomadura hibisca]|uniref:serine hydrolase domain-containing protein n=1 Tax=Actinomadura hibisca TaxID=68565 RepID=UPI000835EF5A|nr:serine hydrolase domain-containing protein [Actinomadura hibisca]
MSRRWSVVLGAGLVVAGLAQPVHAQDRTELGKALERLTAEGGAPGALVEVRDRNGRRTALTSGTRDVRTGAPVQRGSHFRIGSLTKPFVATVMLQLVGEGKIDLDAPVERYLPGVVRGNGNDGRNITVRQLLQHTGGLPDIMRHLNPQDLIKDPLRHWEPEELVAIALQHPNTLPPSGEPKFAYSSTGYLLAGMIIKKVTGHWYGDEIRDRIIKPLKLRGTSVPADSPEIPKPHPQGYAPVGGLLDITRVNPTVADAGGSMISSAADLNRFLAALVRGKLLKPAQLREMKRTVPTGRSSGSTYGLGLESVPLGPGCKGSYWGHGGDMLGFATISGIKADGRRATVMSTLNPGANDEVMEAALKTALC